MLENRAEIPAQSPPPARGKQRLCTLESLDGRTVAARRARELATCFETELGGNVTASQRIAVERAAALVAIAEDARARRLAGEPDVSLEDLVRIDNAAARAVKALGIKAAAPKVPSIREYIASLALLPPAAPSTPAPPTEPAGAEAHQAPAGEAGKASG